MCGNQQSLLERTDQEMLCVKTTESARCVETSTVGWKNADQEVLKLLENVERIFFIYPFSKVQYMYTYVSLVYLIVVLHAA